MMMTLKSEIIHGLVQSAVMNINVQRLQTGITVTVEKSKILLWTPGLFLIRVAKFAKENLSLPVVTSVFCCAIQVHAPHVQRWCLQHVFVKRQNQFLAGAAPKNGRAGSHVGGCSCVNNTNVKIPVIKVIVGHAPE